MNNKNDKTNPIFGGSIGNGPYNYYQEQNFKNEYSWRYNLHDKWVPVSNFDKVKHTKKNPT